MALRPRTLAALELSCLVALAAASWWVLGSAADRWLERAAAAWPDQARSIPVHQIAARASLWFALGTIALAAGRAIALRRARDPIAIPLLVPALVAVCLAGLAIHMATVDLIAGKLAPPGAIRHAGGFAVAGLVGAIVLIAPPRLTPPAAVMPALLGGIVITFVALAAFGSGPAGTRINLGPIQPIELIKVAFVVFCAGYLGRRAAKLRWQRVPLLGLRWPRPRLLVPAIAVLIAIVCALFLVRDLGPTLVLAPVFVGLFYAATRATGWTVSAAAILVLAMAALWWFPALAGHGTVATRVAMWKHPWTNGLDNGAQLGQSLWAIAAGGASGQGLGQNWVPGLPAGKTDLVIATAMEQTGLAGFVLYALLIAAIAGHCFAVAAANRTPERALAAGGIGLLLVVQWALIAAGTFGALPLTGVVAPFASTGRTSLIVFVAAVALVARLAEDGRERAPSEEMTEVRRGVVGLAAAAALALAIVSVVAVTRAVIQRSAISPRGILTTLADGTRRHEQNPRLIALAGQLRRGSLVDRRGAPIAITAAGSARQYPLGAALGRVIGWPPGGRCAPAWSLEGTLHERLRGYPERADAPATRRGGCPGERPIEPIASPDLRAFVPLLEMSPDERRDRIRALDADIARRSVTLTIDGKLQRAVADALAEAAATTPAGAAAAAVIDVDSGEILARAQVPDLDPGETTASSDPGARARFDDPRFAGAYGPWRDKTGLEGVYQTGSIGKLVTAVVAARAGALGVTTGCERPGEPIFSCGGTEVGSFAAPGWGRPIQDHAGGRPHGAIDLATALEVSCNVYFGQLGLSLGPPAYRALADAGVQIGHVRGGRFEFDPGAAGGRKLAETGYGQGGLAMSVVQAARLVAAIGGGGRYRICPPTMERGASCREIRLVDDPDRMRPILAGMHAVIAGSRGTGRRLRPPAGVRVYGKTGTADVLGMAGEEPFGLARGKPAPPHSWFVAVVESETVAACEPVAAGRIAIAVVVPRGGVGSGAAGKAAMAIAEALVALGHVTAAP